MQPRVAVFGMIVVLALAACGPQPGSTADSLASGVRGTVTSGPWCPVVTASPDPKCADRPVAGAVIVVLNAAGGEVARGTTGADGIYRVGLEPGDYVVTGQRQEGLLGTPAPAPIHVDGGYEVVDLVYDTGIR